MKILDILELEQENTQIILHKEGMFWRAYEHSAFLFVKHIKEYSLTKKFYKNVKQEVVYLGFPKNSISKIENICKKQNLSFTEENNQIKIIGLKAFDKNDFLSWKNNITISESESVAQSPCPHSLKENEIIEKIRKFLVISKTPIECQAFIVELQSELTP